MHPSKNRHPSTPGRRTEAQEGRRHQSAHVDTLTLNSVLPFSLYTKLEGEFLLYRKANLPFTLTQKRALVDNGIEFVYIGPAEIDRYWKYIRGNIKGILSDEGDLSARSVDFYRTSSDLTKQLIQVPMEREAIETAQVLIGQTLRLQQEGKSALHSLMEAMEAQPTVCTHSLNVCQYGVALARRYDFYQHDLEALGLGLLFQDLGMLEIPENLVYKAGPLSFEEWDIIKRHPSLSLAAIEKIPDIPELTKSVVFSHHEKLDGSGYPQGLSGTEIPLHIRIASIVDVFTALTTERDFRAANTTFEALRIMHTEMSEQLDMNVLRTFTLLLGREE